MTSTTTGIGKACKHRYAQGIDPNMPWHYYEFYTPKHIIEAVIDVLGGVDLDPCSNSRATPNVPARYVYTKKDNGLQYTWYDRVFLNPPYGYAITEWIDKLKFDYKAGNITEAIALCPASTGTEWFSTMSEYPCCFLRNKLYFLRPNGFKVKEAKGSTAIFYLGDRERRFREVFSKYGNIYTCIQM